MRERKKQIAPRPMQVRLWTLKDKDSMFRAKEPDQHVVELSSKHAILREWSFDTAAKATAHYDFLVNALS